MNENRLREYIRNYIANNLRVRTGKHEGKVYIELTLEGTYLSRMELPDE